MNIGLEQQQLSATNLSMKQIEEAEMAFLNEGLIAEEDKNDYQRLMRSDLETWLADQRGVELLKKYTTPEVIADASRILYKRFKNRGIVIDESKVIKLRAILENY